MVATDYVHYALLYACRMVDSDGKCIKSQGWIESRKNYLDEEYMRIIEGKLSEICLKKEDFHMRIQDMGKFWSIIQI